jgi:hypothetical protein
MCSRKFPDIFLTFVEFSSFLFLCLQVAFNKFASKTDIGVVMMGRSSDKFRKRVHKSILKLKYHTLPLSFLLDDQLGKS